MSNPPQRESAERDLLRRLFYLIAVLSLIGTLINPIAGPICFVVALVGLAILSGPG